MIALAIAFCKVAQSQNIDGRVNGFANNNHKVVISKGATPTSDLGALDATQIGSDIRDFQKEVDEDFRRRGDENVAWIFWRDGRLIHEAYHQKVKSDNYFLGFSITKSVISMAVGAAVCEGKLSLMDMPSKYLPELAGSAYANRTIEDLLLMKSGVRFEETPSAEILFRSVLAQNDTYDATLLRLKVSDYPKENNPNWNYDTNHTEVLGRVLNAVTGGLDKYISDSVWSKIGAQSDAWFAVDKEKRLMSGGGLYAQPKDYLRLGIHALNLVTNENISTCFRNYMQRAISPILTISSAAYSGYGYQIWSKNRGIRNNDGVFEFVGLFGQRVVVDPKTKSVAIALSTREGDLPRFYSLVNKSRNLGTFTNR